MARKPGVEFEGALCAMIVGRNRYGRKVSFIDQVKNELGFKADHRDVIESDGSYVLRQVAEGYTLEFAVENEALRSQNTFFWNEIVDEATT